jgi:hypothetical protein
MHATLCDMIVDLTQNAMEAGATHIGLSVEQTDGEIRVEIRDNGCGMSPEVLERSKDPFFTDGVKHMHRKVGLGLPFLYQTADLTGGEVELESAPGVGTTVRFTLPEDALDLPEFGDLPGAVQLLMAGNYAGELDFSRRVGNEAYALSRSQLEELFEGDLESVENLLAVRELFEDLEAKVKLPPERG